MVKLYPFQEQALRETNGLNRCAFYHEMGLGKTFTGSEKLYSLNAKANLVVCQKSKLHDWIKHFSDNYEFMVYNLTDKNEYSRFIDCVLYGFHECVGIINYDLVWRRKELSKLKGFTLMLDESSLIQNEKSKRSKFILNNLHPLNVILLSGTPVSGKYENLWSQCRLLGWDISKQAYWNTYIRYKVDTRQGFPLKIVYGYKNVDRLKLKLREHGANFLKSDEVIELPEQVFTDIHVPVTKEYKKFQKDRVVSIEDKELVGDTVLTQMLYERQLCGQYNKHKLDALKDLLQSTEDRMIVFYNYYDELYAIEDICMELDKPVSIVNGSEKDLMCYEDYDNSVTLIQYQSGSMGLNLQKANKIVYYTPPVSSDLFEQSKKRVHRIGQGKTCFYYQMVCDKSIEQKIYLTLAMRRDYTESLFVEGK